MRIPFRPGGGYWNPFGPPSAWNPAAYEPPFKDVANNKFRSSDEDFIKDIAVRVSKELRKYERLLEKNGNGRYPTEFDLLNLGNHIIDYVPEKMSRFEKVLDELSNKTEIRVDWVRKLLYEGRYDQIGIGAMTEPPDRNFNLDLVNAKKG